MDQIARTVAFQSGPQSVWSVQNYWYGIVGFIHLFFGKGNPTNTQQGCWEDADSLLVLLDYMKICINAMDFIVQDVSNHTSLSTYSIVKKTPNISTASFPLFLSRLWHTGCSTVDSSWTATRRSQLRKWHKGAALRWFGKAQWDHCWSAIRSQKTMRHFTFCHLEFLDFSRTSSIAVTAATNKRLTLASFTMISWAICMKLPLAEAWLLVIWRKEPWQQKYTTRATFKFIDLKTPLPPYWISMAWRRNHHLQFCHKSH